MEAQKGILYIGIDFGTSRIAISASNGVYKHFPSYVGYPKDAVARKVIKKDVLFGQEAFDNRLSLNLYRPVEVLKNTSLKDDWTEEEVEKNVQAAIDLIKFTISSAEPNTGDLIYAVIGLPSEASINNKQKVIDAAKAAGVDSVIIIPEPFAVAYGVGELNNSLLIDIGAGSTDLGRMTGALLEDDDQKTLEYAGDYITSTLYKLMKEGVCKEADFTIHTVNKIKETFATINLNTEKFTVMLPVKGKPTEFDITDYVKEACGSIVKPIVEAMQELIASFDPDFQRVIRNNVIICGGGSLISGFSALFEEELEAYGGGRVTCVETPVYAGAKGALRMAHDMPEDYWRQLS